MTELFRNSILHQNLSFQQQTTENNNKLDTDEFGITFISATTEKYHNKIFAENNTGQYRLERYIWHVLCASGIASVVCRICRSFFIGSGDMMKIPTQLIFDDENEPAAAVVPYSVFQKCFLSGRISDHLPLEVKILIRQYGFSPVKAWRIHRGFKIRNMAKKLDISVDYYKKIEEGKPHYPIYDRKIAELFQIPLELIEPEKEMIGLF